MCGWNTVAQSGRKEIGDSRSDVGRHDNVIPSAGEFRVGLFCSLKSEVRDWVKFNHDRDICGVCVIGKALRIVNVRRLLGLNSQ